MYFMVEQHPDGNKNHFCISRRGQYWSRGYYEYYKESKNLITWLAQPHGVGYYPYDSGKSEDPPPKNCTVFSKRAAELKLKHLIKLWEDTGY